MNAYLQNLMIICIYVPTSNIKIKTNLISKWKLLVYSLLEQSNTCFILFGTHQSDAVFKYKPDTTVNYEIEDTVIVSIYIVGTLIKTYITQGFLIIHV